MNSVPSVFIGPSISPLPFPSFWHTGKRDSMVVDEMILKKKRAALVFFRRARRHKHPKKPRCALGFLVKSRYSRD